MYEYISDKIGIKAATVVMAIWYFVLLYMVLFFLNYEAGIFNYLKY